MSGKGKGKRSKPAAENGASYGDGTTNGVGDLKKAKYENGNGHCKNGNGHFKNGNSANGGKKSSHLYLRSTLKDEGTVKQLRESWSSSKELHLDNDKIGLFSEPFPCCSLKQFLETKNQEDLGNLIQELDDLDYAQKNNDLYKFRQSGDLKNVHSSLLRQFRHLMENDVKDWLSGVTGIEFSSNVDMFSARYDYTDYLLCHDDELEGRRIAFIWYLVPQSWSKQDGGALDLFSMDTETGQPTEVSRSLVPSRNSFVFFEVTPKSFHQVAEVLTRDKTRLSIGGWFHGKSVERPDKIIEPRVSPDTPVDIDEDSFFDWINPLYLDPGNQAEIQENFEANSEISLQDFLTGEKYSEIGEALKSSDLKWTQRGPPNKQHYRVVAGQEMPEVVKECVQFLKSDAMFLFLSNLTGLKLHALAPCDDDDEEDEDKEESGEDGEESSENDNGEKDFQKEKSPVPSSSQDTDDDETKRKKLKEKEESKKSAKKKKKKPFDPRCLSEVRRWEHGSYTMVRDDDPEQAEFALDARLFFNCKDWSLEVGGYTSYVARDEDEELLTAQPEENSLILVYRDNKTMKFVKRITDEINRMPETSFHDIAVTYYE